MPKFIDLTGRRFYHLTVVEKAERKNQKTRWKCLCDCGKYTYTITNRLLHGKTRSCGCKASEQRNTHRLSNTRIYKTWMGMKRRCYNPKNKSYQRYGGRGITVCDEWKNDFMNFYQWAMKNGYNDTLTIDRIDNNAPYSPENCRWATLDQQKLNRRNTVYVNANGKIIPLKTYCQLYAPSAYSRAVQRRNRFIKQGIEFTTEMLVRDPDYSHLAKPVNQYSIDGTFIRKWDSLSTAANALNIDKSCISSCCRGKTKTSHGYVWCFA